jgi:hypothetical protein
MTATAQQEKVTDSVVLLAAWAVAANGTNTAKDEMTSTSNDADDRPMVFRGLPIDAPWFSTAIICGGSHYVSE